MKAETQIASFNDFSGGMTDYPIMGNLTQGERVENFLITPQKKLIIREGSLLYHNPDNVPTVLSVLAAEGNPSNLFYANFLGDKQVFVQTKNKLFAYDSVIWYNLAGPNGSAFECPDEAELSEFGTISHGVYNNEHLYIVGGDENTAYYPIKIYKDEEGSFKLYTAGLPSLKNTLTIKYSFNMACTFTFPATDGPVVVSTSTAHGLVTGDVVLFYSTGTLPYDAINPCETIKEVHLSTPYIVEKIDDTSFYIRETFGGDYVGNDSDNINESGTHYIYGLLEYSCAIASKIKSLFNSHISDYGSTYPTNAHKAAQPSFSETDPTDLNSLIAFTKNLHQAFSIHIRDIKISSSYNDSVYHFLNSTTDEVTSLSNSGALSLKPNNYSIVNNLQEVIPILNNLLDVYHFHIFDFVYNVIESPPTASLYKRCFPYIHGNYSPTIFIIKPIPTELRITKDQGTFKKLWILEETLYSLKNTFKQHYENTYDYGSGVESNLHSTAYTDSSNLTNDQYVVPYLVVNVNCLSYDLFNTNGFFKRYQGTGSTIIPNWWYSFQILALVHIYNEHLGTFFPYTYYNNYHYNSSETYASEQKLSFNVASDIVTIPDIESYAGASLLGSLLTSLSSYKSSGAFDYHHYDVATSGTTDAHRVAALPELEPTLSPYSNFVFRPLNYGVSVRYEYTLYSGKMFIDESEVLYTNQGVYIYKYTDSAGREKEIGNASGSVENSIVLVPPNFYKLDQLNYPTGILVRFYRQESSGNAYYLVAESEINNLPINTIVNPRISFFDNFDDRSLAENEPLYTSQAFEGNGPVPRARCFIVANNCGWYGDVWDRELDQVTGEIKEVHYPNRVRQSIQGDIDSCPGTYFVDLPSEVISLFEVRGTPIAVTSDGGVYRIENIFTESTSAYTTLIHKTAGALSKGGAISTYDKGYFAGKSMFYVCDGYNVLPIAEHLQKSYVETSDNGFRIRAAYDEEERRIYWLMPESPYNTIWTLDLTLPVGKESSFTKLCGKAYTPTAICFYEGNRLLRATNKLLYIADRDTYYDEYYSFIATNPIEDHPIIYDFLSSCVNGGSDRIKKWATNFDLTLKSMGGDTINIQPYLVNEMGRNFSEAELINGKKYTGKSSPIVWQSTPLGLIEQKKKFPAGSLRFLYRQLGITNTELVLDSYEECKVMLTTMKIGSKYVAVLDTGHKFLGSDLMESSLYLGPSYDTAYTILEGSKSIETDAEYDTIMLDGVPPLGRYEWQLRGYKLSEKFELMSMNMPYMAMSDSKDVTQASSEVPSV